MQMELGNQTGIAILVGDKIDFKPKREEIRKVTPSILINRKIHQAPFGHSSHLLVTHQNTKGKRRGLCYNKVEVSFPSVGLVFRTRGSLCLDQVLSYVVVPLAWVFSFCCEFWNSPRTSEPYSNW